MGIVDQHRVGLAGGRHHLHPALDTLGILQGSRRLLQRDPQLQGNAQKAKDTLAMTESGLEQLYITFNSLIGVNPDERFEFLYDVTFEAYELPLPIDLYIHNKMNEDINIKMQELSMEAAKFASATSALKCTRFGAQEGIPGFDEVIEFINAREGA